MSVHRRAKCERGPEEGHGRGRAWRRGPHSLTCWEPSSFLGRRPPGTRRLFSRNTGRVLRCNRCVEKRQRSTVRELLVPWSLQGPGAPLVVHSFGLRLSCGWLLRAIEKGVGTGAHATDLVSLAVLANLGEKGATLVNVVCHTFRPPRCAPATLPVAFALTKGSRPLAADATGGVWQCWCT